MAGRIAGEETKRFRKELLADVLEHAETEGQEAFLQEAFTDLVLDDLEESGEWPDYQLAHYSAMGARVDAWAVDDLRRILFLAATDFSPNEESETIGASELTRMVNRLSTFVDRAQKGRIDVEEHNPVSDLVDELRAQTSFDEVRLHLIVDRVASSSPAPSRSGYVREQARVWDLESIRRIRSSGSRLEPIDVNLGDISALNGGRDSGVGTYLLFLPASRLASLYHEHGARLLERNVRAFLSARGKVNRGLRETLKSEPERFLAYNNGLTATAAGVETDESGSKIISIRDLQIVNGGQTTASIAQAAKDPTIDIDNVFVQMKLVVVDPALIDELVPNISRFANSQNSVQESDLSANHPFLRKFQEASRTEYTPPTATGRPTKWYFERARGGYGVDEARAETGSARQRFASDYPKGQRFGKNDLAVYENTWNQLPHIVSRGGQKNFTEFMLHLEGVPEDLTDEESDSWYRARFRQAVAKAILFKSTDRAVQKALSGTYKRAVVAYTLSFIVASAPRPPDLDAVWRAQAAPPSYIDEVVEVARAMKDMLIESARGRNITEWAKHEACWTTLQRLNVEVPNYPRTDSAATEPRATLAQPRVEQRSAEALDLSQVIERIHGEPIIGRYRRYRRRVWQHIGDTGVPGARAGTLHAYEGEFNDGNDGRYGFRVVVDFASRLIVPVESLGEPYRSQVESWLAEHDR